jgi:hypothetical protein
VGWEQPGTLEIRRKRLEKGLAGELLVHWWEILRQNKYETDQEEDKRTEVLLTPHE